MKNRRLVLSIISDEGATIRMCKGQEDSNTTPTYVIDESNFSTKHMMLRNAMVEEEVQIMEAMVEILHSHCIRYDHTIDFFYQKHDHPHVN